MSTLAVTSLVSAAQLYRWVDDKGNVEWRDTPPPSAAKKVEQRRMGSGVVGGADTSFAAQLAAKNHPVTFWSASDCGKTCDAARAHLAKRGVPYTETSPRADAEGFKKISPSNEIPILQVGRTTLKGYLDSEWDSVLDSAGYPRSGPAVKPTVIQPKPPAQAAPATPAAPAAPATAASAPGNTPASSPPPAPAAPPAPVTVPVVR
jgi:hypothetical protein